MGKKYHSKKYKKHQQEAALAQDDSNGLLSPDKEKKIIKEPRTKETSLSDIELQIIDMFSRSFTNGQIGVKYPQQKKKGMMRLMNYCFRTIIDEAELYINSNLQKEANTSKCLDKREKTIFYLSSNYRYKHIEKSLLEDFKIICKNYVKYHCLEHMDPKFLEKFYKKVIYNEFSADTSEIYKNNKAKLEKAQIQDGIEQSIGLQQNQTGSLKSPKKETKTQNVEATIVKKKPGAKRGRKRKNFNVEVEAPKETLIYETNQKDNQDLQMISSMVEPHDKDLKGNKICIEKINIYLGYDAKLHGKKQGNQDLTKIHAHPYARMEVQENQNRLTKRKWTNDMESELIDQFMNTSATSPNIIIRNLMKKFGRNKLFVESEIQAKRKEMFKTSISKFINAFDGKTLCSQEAVRKMQNLLRNMSLSPKNYFIASFIHDFYFKQVQAISVTLLSEYIHKLSRQEGIIDKNYSKQNDLQEDDNINEKKKILQRQDLKYALNTMSKLVSNYNYDLIE